MLGGKIGVGSHGWQKNIEHHLIIEAQRIPIGRTYLGNIHFRLVEHRVDLRIELVYDRLRELVSNVLQLVKRTPLPFALRKALRYGLNEPWISPLCRFTHPHLIQS